MRREHALNAALALALATAALLLHTGGLEGPRLAPRESELAACADAGGTNQDGGLPIFVACRTDVLLPPVPVYTSIVARGVWPAPPQRIRVGPALVGALDVVLLFVLALRLFASRLVATLTALVLLTSPGHIAFSRVASTDGIWVVPFVLVWLIAIAAMTEAATPVRRRWAAVAGLIAAGLALYTQPSGAMLTVGIVALTIWSGVRSGMPRVELVPALVAFAATLTPAIIWLGLHPSGYASTLGRWLLHPAHIRRPADWFAAMTNWQSLTSMTNVFWDFFSPTHLFINDRAPGLAAVFLLPVIVPIVAGARASLSARIPQNRREVLFVAAAGAILCALTVAGFKEPRGLHLGLAVVVFGALFAGAGTAWLLERRTTAARATLIGVLVTCTLQFGWWYAQTLWPGQDP